jgi:hypothetical protein
MISKIQKTKHWVLFTLMFGLPIFFQFVIGLILMLTLSAEGYPSILGFLSFFSLFPLIMILYIGVFFSWVWSIGIGLQKYIKEGIKLNTRLFKVFFFIPLIYILFLLLTFSTSFFPGVLDGNQFESHIGYILAMMIPLHLFSMFCMFFLIYFSAKTLKTAELHRKATLNDYIGEFFLFWFFPIGIWFIQPRINNIVSKDFIK